MVGLTLVMGLICIVIILILYVVSGGWKTYGGLFGIAKWLKQGGLQSGQKAGRSKSSQHGNPAQNVVTVLDDVYRDFSKRIADVERESMRRLGAEKKLLHDRIEELEIRLEALEAGRQFGMGQASTVQSGTDEDANSDYLVDSAPASEHSAPPPTAPSTTPVATHLIEDGDFNPQYFAVLDYLYAGVDVRKIAEALKLPVTEVEAVKRIMASPGPESPGSD